jgi:hypothetical protein
MELKHTPTPWRVVNGSLIKDELMPFDRDERDTVLIATTAGNAPAALAEANAAFIVRACNSHEQLAAALRCGRVAIDVLMAQLIEADPSFMPTKSAVWPSLVAITDALAVVEAA